MPLTPRLPAWEWSLRLTRYGSPADPRPAADAWPLASQGDFDLLRGPLREWVVIGRRGIVHGVELSPDGDVGQAHFEFALGGSLTPKVAADGRGVKFTDARGAAVHEARDLRATDAEGRDVDARWERIEPSSGHFRGLRLVVAAAEHLRPLTISSVLTTPKGRARPSAAETMAAEILATGPPANDLCTEADVIPGTGPFPYLTSTYDITDATTTGDPPAPECQTNLSRSVWFRFTPAVSAPYTLSLCGDAPTATTVEDTVLAVYTAGAECSGFVDVVGGCDDDGCGAGTLRSLVQHLDLRAGATYYILAWKYGTLAPAAGASGVQLRVEQEPLPGPAPPNDRCSGAEVIPGAGPFPYLTPVIADIGGATSTGDPPTPSCQSNVWRSIWYTFTPQSGGRYSFSLCADAPTATTVDDTVMAIYAGGGACSALAEVAGGCDDDSCLGEAGQSVLRGVELSAGTSYSIVVWKYDTAPPAAGDAAVQLRVTRELAPANDTCGAASALALERPLGGTTANAADDTQLPVGSTCFAGIGQTPSTAPGGDVVYTFTAPRDGRFSFRAGGFESAHNAVLYVASDCPPGPAPVTVSDCLGAANRNVGYPAEEVACLPLSSGQAVYVTVDESIQSAGSAFTIEAVTCVAEAEPNDSPALAGAPACGIEGSIGTAGDIDFFALGVSEPGSRLFAMVDGAAGGSTDFDLRLTTTADTLEYDDLNGDTPFGSVSPNLAGTPLPGSAAYLRVSHYSAATAAEPYRLFAAVQPPAPRATPEAEPNDAPANATRGAITYFAGALSSASDLDLFAFEAEAGEMILAGLDLDPGRDGTPFNGWLALLDGSGSALVSVNDGGATSSSASGAGSLAATSPHTPGEAMAWRARASGTYFVKVAASGSAPGDYLLSIARDCRGAPPLDSNGDSASDFIDCAPSDPSAWALPGEARSLGFPVASDHALLAWSAPGSPGGTTVTYDLLRSPSAGDFSAPACVVKDATSTSATDPAVPAGVAYYLVRARNRCGASLGARSSGAPRLAGACP